LFKLSRILNKSKSETYIGKQLRHQWKKYANTQNKLFLNHEFVVFFGLAEDTVSEKEESESKNQSFI